MQRKAEIAANVTLILTALIVGFIVLRNYARLEFRKFGHEIRPYAAVS